MFICENECQDAGDSATAKYTKLECTLGGQWQNCDISLVDGFSLPIKCTIPGAQPLPYIGGTDDLGDDCPAQGDDGTCKNSNAYEADVNAVTPYFQKANWVDKDSTNNYCTWQTCNKWSDIFFSDQPTIECEVGHRKSSSSSTSKRDNTISRREERLAARSHGHRHSHAHAQVRGLKDLVV